MATSMEVLESRGNRRTPATGVQHPLRLPVSRPRRQRGRVSPGSGLQCRRLRCVRTVVGGAFRARARGDRRRAVPSARIRLLFRPRLGVHGTRLTRRCRNDRFRRLGRGESVQPDGVPRVLLHGRHAIRLLRAALRDDCRCASKLNVGRRGQGGAGFWWAVLRRSSECMTALATASGTLRAWAHRYRLNHNAVRSRYFNGGSPARERTLSSGPPNSRSFWSIYGRICGL